MEWYNRLKRTLFKTLFRDYHNAVEVLDLLWNYYRYGQKVYTWKAMDTFKSDVLYMFQEIEDSQLPYSDTNIDWKEFLARRKVRRHPLENEHQRTVAAEKRKLLLDRIERYYDQNCKNRFHVSESFDTNLREGLRALRKKYE